jgi:hypothetical protein
LPGNNLWPGGSSGLVGGAASKEGAKRDTAPAEVGGQVASSKRWVENRRLSCRLLSLVLLP